MIKDENSSEFSEDLLYWTETLSDIEGFIKHYNVHSNQLDCYDLHLSKESFLEIEKFITKYDITHFEFFTSIFSIYLSRINQSDGCILKTFISKNGDDSRFNTLLKLLYNKNTPFTDYVVYVSQMYDEISFHTHANVEDYVGNIVDLVFYSINDFTTHSWRFEDNNSVLTFNIYQNKLEMVYNSLILSSVYIKHMMNNIFAVICDVLDSPDKLLGDIDILSDDEKDLINTFCKGDDIDFDNDYTLAKAFRYNALKNPNKIAIDDGISQITYGELEKSSNSIAYILQNKFGIEKGTPVALMIPRTYHFLELVLALNKIGTYFIFIDSNYPIKRIEHIIKLSQVKHIIVTEDYEFLHDFDIEVMILNNLEKNLDEYIEINSKGDDLFSIIFTSGTTGLPKGVSVSNKQINNWHAFLNLIDSSSDDIMGIYREFTFIGSYWMFAALYQNMTCRLFNESEQKDIPFLINEFESGNISLIDIPDSIIRPIFENNDIKLKYLLTGGSKIKKLHIGEDTEVIILYGTTETNMTSFYHLNLNNSDEKIPIGRPAPNKWIYILDNEYNMTPIGVPGEICISSEYMSEGYFNRVDLTNKVFVENPFSNCMQNRRLYHTGDIGFYNFDGQLEIIGRSDDQLSVRGFRVESDEILRIMNRFDGFSEIILDVVDDLLIAYYTINKDIELQQVKEALIDELPVYMIPSMFVEIDEIPLNANGKIDKSKLPKKSIVSENVQPANEVELELLQICQEISDNVDFGVTDNLVAVGFSSLSFMKLNYEIHSRLDINLNFIDLIECSTVREISNILNNENLYLFKKYEKRDFYPLTKNQTLICHDRTKNPNIFKMFYTVKIYDVDVFKFKDAFIKAINMHPFLKASLINKNGTFYIKRDDYADISDLVNIYNLNKFDFDLFEKHLFEVDCDFYDDFFKSATTSYGDKFFYCVIVENDNNIIVRVLFDHITFDYYSISLLFSEIDKIYFEKEDKIEKEVIDGFDYNMFIIDDEKESGDLLEKYRDEVINYGDLFIPLINEYENDCCEHDGLAYRLSKDLVQSFCNKYDIPYNRFFMATLALTLHKYSGLNKGILPVVSNGRFFNELMYTQHYLAKTIYLKFEFNEDMCLNDVFENISQDMKRIITMEPNSYIFIYDNQWLFNFIETGQDNLNFKLTDFNHDKNKPNFIKNVGKNVINDVEIFEIDDFYELYLKYHNKRYDKKYISSFLNCWADIIQYIILNDDLDMNLSFLDDIYENYVVGDCNV